MSYANNYGSIDRALHYFAFASPVVQRVLAELESDLYRKQLKNVPLGNEVLITGLPRAGTTLMLELICRVGEFATYTYRDMPFVLAPLLWRGISRSFRKAGTRMERAHGDGMEISFDSPEAFEEVIWLSCLGDRIVGPTGLEPLDRDAISEEVADALRDTMRKVVATHGSPEEPDEGAEMVWPRYLSKNNANISRLDAIAEILPTATVLVVFRNPAAHIASLHTQHQRFLREHAADAFARRYMKWIGHYEFGENFKPINFDGWLEDAPDPARVDLRFWLRYWIAAYRFALERRGPNVHFIDFDELLRNGPAVLARVADTARIRDKKGFCEAAAGFRSPTTTPRDLDENFGSMRDEAADLHAQLEAVAV